MPDPVVEFQLVLAELWESLNEFLPSWFDDPATTNPQTLDRAKKALRAVELEYARQQVRDEFPHMEQPFGVVAKLISWMPDRAHPKRPTTRERFENGEVSEAPLYGSRAREIIHVILACPRRPASDWSLIHWYSEAVRQFRVLIDVVRITSSNSVGRRLTLEALPHLQQVRRGPNAELLQLGREADVIPLMDEVRDALSFLWSVSRTTLQNEVIFREAKKGAQAALGHLKLFALPTVLAKSPASEKSGRDDGPLVTPLTVPLLSQIANHSDTGTLISGFQHREDGAGQSIKGSKVPPVRASKAWSQYNEAARALGELNPDDGAAYAKLKEMMELEGDRDPLPTFESWSRNLREYRRLTGNQKNKPRGGRHCDSAIPASQLASVELPTSLRRAGNN